MQIEEKLLPHQAGPEFLAIAGPPQRDRPHTAMFIDVAAWLSRRHIVLPEDIPLLLLDVGCGSVLLPSSFSPGQNPQARPVS